MDVGGGAAIAACRHVEANLHNHIDAQLLVRSKRGNKAFVRKLSFGLRSPLKLLYKTLHRRDLKKMGPTGNFSVMKYGHPFHKDKAVREADVIFLHWISFNTLSVKGIEKILKLGKPTYWYLHDMFAFTGGCHYSLHCKEYTDKCKSCPLVSNDKARRFIERQLAEKLQLWRQYDNLHFVTPSNWLAECVRESTLGKGKDVYVFPNLLDTDLYKPLETSNKPLGTSNKPLETSTKEKLGLDVSKKTILIGAADLGSVYKGGQLLHDCLKELNPDRYEALVIGNASEEFTEDLPINVVATGFINEDRLLVEAYNASDVFVITSVADNYPNMILEAMACGVPCVGTNTGGIPDLIRDGRSGYLVKERSASQLKQKIELLFSDRDKYIEFAHNCRQLIVENNSYNTLGSHLDRLNIKR